jgi:hypothetical protein
MAKENTETIRRNRKENIETIRVKSKLTLKKEIAEEVLNQSNQICIKNCSKIGLIPPLLHINAIKKFNNKIVIYFKKVKIS